MEQPQGDEQPRDEVLVRKAFAAALQTGRPDWDKMTLGVLKNRMIDASGGTFDEQQQGYPSFTAFLRATTRDVVVDWDVRPPIAQLTPAARAAIADGEPDPRALRSPSRRIRPDLWRAVIDYSSGATHFWDATARTAVHTGPGEEPPADALRLPTLEKNEITTWRREFATGALQDEPEFQDELERWVEEGLPTAALPQAMRGRWNRFQTDRVVARLEEWFGEHALAQPELWELPGRQVPPRPSGLRDVVRKCVDAMTPAELSRLSIPATVVARLLRAEADE